MGVHVSSKSFFPDVTVYLVNCPYQYLLAIAFWDWVFCVCNCLKSFQDSEQDAENVIIVNMATFGHDLNILLSLGLYSSLILILNQLSLPCDEEVLFSSYKNHYSAVGNTWLLPVFPGAWI